MGLSPSPRRFSDRRYDAAFRLHRKVPASSQMRITETAQTVFSDAVRWVARPWKSLPSIPRMPKTVGDCPDFPVPWEENGTVPFSETVFDSYTSTVFPTQTSTVSSCS